MFLAKDLELAQTRVGLGEVRPSSRCSGLQCCDGPNNSFCAPQCKEECSTQSPSYRFNCGVQSSLFVSSPERNRSHYCLHSRNSIDSSLFTQNRRNHVYETEDPKAKYSHEFKELAELLEEHETESQTRACANCYKRHVKCDKQLPCSRCLRQGIKCEPQRDKKKRKKRNSSQSHVITIIEKSARVEKSLLKRTRNLEKSPRDLLKDYYSVRACNIFEAGIWFGLPFNRCAMKVLFDPMFSYQLDKLHKIFQTAPISMVESLPTAVATYTISCESNWLKQNFCRLVKGRNILDCFGDFIEGSENSQFLSIYRVLQHSSLDFLSFMYMFSFDSSLQDIPILRGKEAFWNQSIKLPNGEIRLFRIGRKAVEDPETQKSKVTFQIQDITFAYPSWTMALRSLHDFKDQLEPTC